jgi:hypothetical protein
MVTAAAVAASGSGGCGRPGVPAEVRRAGEALDRAEAGVEEWGTVTVSAPLIEAPDGGSDRFQFDLKKGPDDYFADAQANVQGRAAEFEQVVNRFGLGVDVGMNPMIADQYYAGVAKYQRQQADYESDEANRRALAARQQDLKLQAAESRYREQTKRAAMTRDAALKDAAARRDAATNAAGASADAVAAAKAQYGVDEAAAQAAYDTAVADADRARAEAIPVGQPGTPPTYPDPVKAPDLADPKTAPDASEARAALAADKFKDAMGLLAGDRKRPVLADRTAINIAAGDTATEAIFSLLGHPDLAGRFKDRQVLFGVSMVAVNPGWRTRKGYAADVAVISRYSYGPARREVVEAFVADETVDPGVRKMVATEYRVATTRPSVVAAQPATTIPPELDHAMLNVDGHGIPADGGPSPLVAAVSPMTETQSLGLESSYRSQRELAIRLSFALQAAGLKAQAAAFQQFVKSLQQDVETATAVNTVNAYSHLGGMFGFQVGPRLVAIEQVRKGKSSGAAEILDRQSFPTLIIFGVNRAETVRLGWVGGKVTVYEAQLLLTSQPSWMPTDEGTSGDRLLPSHRLALAYEMAEKSSALLQAAERVDTAARAANQPMAKSPEQAARAKELARGADAIGRITTLMDVRRSLLRYKFFGVNVKVMLPADTFRQPAVQAPAAAAPVRP